MQKKTTLVILAAGIGSRFGGGVKQLAPVGPNGEVIIDYSIHDAIKAGFNKIVFIIRHDIEEEFREVIGNRMQKFCDAHGVELCYAFQELANIPMEVPEGRKKPWGTGHAILSTKGIVKEAFAVINADDYYGTEGFKKAYEFLQTNQYGMVGFRLGNTLSENGGVTRGICSVKDGLLTEVVETFEIVKTEDGAASFGKPLSLDAVASMNLWCLPAEFLDVLEAEFPPFLASMTNPQKDEYLLPTIVGKLVEQGVAVTVMTTPDRWFGVTYKEDKEYVVESFRKLYEQGVYQKDLYSDIK